MLFMSDIELDENSHFPVLGNEVIEIVSKYCQSFNKIVFVDCTLGLGGHASSIIPLLQNSEIFLIDRDIKSIEIASKRLAAMVQMSNVRLMNISFSKFFEDFFKIVDFSYDFLIVFADLGISYYQIKQPGFSYSREGALDMRYDHNLSLTAGDIVNNFEYDQIYQILLPVFENFRLTRRLSNAIYQNRGKINKTTDLNKVVSKVVSSKILKDVLQKLYLALRIFVNDELGELQKLLNFFQNYNRDFLLMIITYHSLEGKLVKSFIKNNSFYFEKIKPTKEEIKNNKPSRSAILWVITNRFMKK